MQEYIINEWSRLIKKANNNHYQGDYDIADVYYKRAYLIIEYYLDEFLACEEWGTGILKRYLVSCHNIAKNLHLMKNNDSAESFLLVAYKKISEYVRNGKSHVKDINLAKEYLREARISILNFYIKTKQEAKINDLTKIYFSEENVCV